MEGATSRFSVRCKNPPEKCNGEDLLGAFNVALGRKCIRELTDRARGGGEGREAFIMESRAASTVDIFTSYEIKAYAPHTLPAVVFALSLLCHNGKYFNMLFFVFFSRDRRDAERS